MHAGTDSTAIQRKSISLSGQGTGIVDWSKLNGPGEVQFSNYQSGSTNVTFSEPGTYVLRLTSTQGNRRSVDDVTITVFANAEPFNKAHVSMLV